MQAPGGIAGIAETGRRTRGRPTLEDVAQIEARLLAVGLQAFLAKGYGGVSMSYIIQMAGVSKTTLYSRFHSKDALFRAIMHQQVDRLAAATALTSSNGPLELLPGLKAYANKTLRISLEGDLLAVNRLIYGEFQRFPELGLAAAERTELGIAQVAWFIDQCAHAGALRCRDSRSTAEAFIFLLRGWYINALISGRAISASEREEWVDRVVPAFIAGCDLT